MPRLFGPVSLSLTMANLALFVAYVLQGVGVVNNQPFAHIIAMIAAIVAGAFILAWVVDSSRLYMFALLASTGVWVAMVWMYLQRFGFNSTATTLGIAWATLASTSWLYERHEMEEKERSDG